MIVTSIVKQKGNKDRYNIYVDNNYSFSMDYEDLMKFNIKENMLLDDNEYGELIYNYHFKKALNKAYSFLSYRPRTEYEIRKKLNSCGFSELIVDNVIEKLKEFNYINDEEFSRTWVEERVKLKPSGRQKIINELREKGIKKEIINDVLDQSAYDDMDTAKNLALKKIKAINGNIKDVKNYYKVYRYLIYRGFDYNTARKAIAECIGEELEED